MYSRFFSFCRILKNTYEVYPWIQMTDDLVCIGHSFIVCITHDLDLPFEIDSN